MKKEEDEVNIDIPYILIPFIILLALVGYDFNVSLVTNICNLGKFIRTKTGTKK